jgi:L-asparaginase/Glu-tRNA(Gln) amidotransferase subunit D
MSNCVDDCNCRDARSSYPTLLKILVIETGGTISCRKNLHTNKLEPHPGVVQQHIREHPSFESIRNRIDVRSFPKPIDSSNLSIDNWRQIVEVIASEYKNYRGFVVTHGTDTLAYTASFLSFCFFFQSFPIVLTAAQCPLESAYTDAHNNLYGACVVALGFDPQAESSFKPHQTFTNIEGLLTRGSNGNNFVEQERIGWFFPETVVFMNHKCMLGTRVKKLDATAIDSFDSPSEDYVGAFHSTFVPDRQVLHRLCETRMRALASTARIDLDNAAISRETLVDVSLLVTVPTIAPAMIKLFPCADQLEIILEALFASGVRHFVLEAFGSGNASDSVRTFVTTHSDTSYFAVVTQCLKGFAIPVYSTAIDTHSHVAICANMTAECAFAKLTNWASLSQSAMLSSPANLSFQRYMESSLRDELDELEVKQQFVEECVESPTIPNQIEHLIEIIEVSTTI